jgi:hypothetical protein
MSRGAKNPLSMVMFSIMVLGNPGLDFFPLNTDLMDAVEPSFETEWNGRLPY